MAVAMYNARVVKTIEKPLESAVAVWRLNVGGVLEESGAPNRIVCRFNMIWLTRMSRLKKDEAEHVWADT